MDAGSGTGQAHDATVATDVSGALTPEQLAEHAVLQKAREREVAETSVAGCRRKVEKAQNDLAAAEAALAEAEAALAALEG